MKNLKKKKTPLRELIIAELKLFYRDKKAVFLTVFFPVFLMLLFGSLFSYSTQEINFRVGVVNYDQGSLSNNIIIQLTKNKILTVSTYENLEDATIILKKGKIDMIVIFPSDFSETIIAKINNKSSEKTTAIEVVSADVEKAKSAVAVTVIQKLIADANRELVNGSETIRLDSFEISITNRKEIRYVDYLTPGLISLVIILNGIYTTLSILSNLKEKLILRRFQTTPLSKSIFIASLIVTRLLITVVSVCLMLMCGVFVFNIILVGNISYLLVTVLLGGLIFVAIGLAIAGYSSSPESAQIIAHIIVFPMLLIGDVFVPVSMMPLAIQRISNLLPITYIASSIRGIMLYDYSFFDLWSQFLILGCIGVFCYSLATIVFRWDR